jgi:NAD(P)-dependent dehydrogenase (short-subunit alcohol dehydrogenase family)
MQDPSQPQGALTGKVAVVVGGASGIGRTAAKALARQGSRIVIADFDSERMERTVEEILALGTTDAAQSLPTDVRSDSSARSLAEDSVKSMGQVDILLNMAAVLLKGPLQKTKTADWKWVLETNLLGVVRTTMAFVPHMTGRKSGHIVNTIGAGGLEPQDALTVPYDTAQVAVASFTRSLARELEPAGVHVSLYCTGSKGPRIGQNTRSRGLGRLLHKEDEVEEGTASDQWVDPLLEALHRPRLLVYADASDDAARLEPATTR